ncbi:DsrH/TusB family sulfur metabolism protein [Acinetobacter sp. YH12126]|uniref:DsrH/TusB family sulfur metabolism protein n=1 Tax=Acinetobacter sp. YH12126 TaxID=2601111 RepID=UPI0015D40119|nr:DsrH/TusB family sulfur metabolism protein [Acinetobacter sp. YH12126]
MSNSTLYLVQASYANTLQHIQQLASLINPEDSIILMGEAVLHIADEQIQQFGTCYVLENDAEILSKSMNYSHMKVIDYAAFTDLCLRFKRCISLK